MTRYIGKPVPLSNAEDLVTGRVKFSRDLMLPGMLHAATVWSPHPHARVIKINTAPALTLKGVMAVATAKDIKGVNSYGVPKADQPVLVPEGETVKMVGDPVAVVAAETEELARRAADLVRVKYEALEPVLDYEKACLEKSPLIHSESFQGQYEFIRGDLEKGLAESDLVLEETFYAPRQEHAYLEPEGGISYLDMDGSLVVCSGMQIPHRLRYFIAHTLNVKEHKIRVIIPPMGGAFGGKQSVSVHIHMALLTLMTKRPMRMLWTREESLKFHIKRHPAKMRAKIGLKKNGKIIAYSINALFDGGAYAHQSPGIIYWGGMHAAGPYDIPNLSILGQVVYTNNVSSGAFRGFGGPKYVTALERMVDMAARKLGIDPIEIRRCNALTESSSPGLREARIDGPVSLNDTIDGALETAGTNISGSGNKKMMVGRGVACAMPLFDVSADPIVDLKGAGALVEMGRDGNMEIRTGIVEFGSGIATVLKQVVAEEFNTDIDQISIVIGDTFLCPKAGPQVASRAAYVQVHAVRQAAVSLRKRLSEKAAEIFKVQPYAIKFEDSLVFVEDQKENVMTIAELANRAWLEGVNMQGYYWFEGSHAGAGHTFLTSIADVEVDPDTGETTVNKIVISHDAGRVLNPIGLRGQLLGAALQMQGWALTEDLPSNDGKVIADRLGDYLIPTSLDAPESMPVHHVEEPYPTGPYGAKGVGEHAAYSTAASILNAIADATGVELSEWPATACRVWEKLQERRRENE